MSSTFYGNIIVSVFGQSHSEAIGVTIEGIPAGFEPDIEKLCRFLDRRAPGNSAYSTARKEADLPQFIGGIFEGKTCGAPVTAIIRNTDVHSEEYAKYKLTPRPGHADYTAEVKFGGYQDYAGGGHFSGRMTAPLCIAGGLCIQLLEKEGIEIISRISEIGGICDKGELEFSTAGKQFPVADDESGRKMKEAIEKAKKEGDSLGGIIECIIRGVPAGIGNPIFGGLENRISRTVFAIPAVKGIEFGEGFKAARLRGSENNDSFEINEKNITTRTNHCGGILGGISDGMPIVFRAAVKPTPSIVKMQSTVDLVSEENVRISVGGRHDPCIVPRAVPCVESAAAIAVYDAVLERRMEKYYGY